VLNIFVSQVVLNRPGIVAVIGQFEAGGMAEHVWMDGEPQLCCIHAPRDDHPKLGVGQGTVALRHKHIGRVGVGTCQLAERAQYNPI
jgi:hypothetical protein